MTFSVPLGAPLYALLPPRERKWALLPGPVSASRAAGRRFEAGLALEMGLSVLVAFRVPPGWRRRLALPSCRVVAAKSGNARSVGLSETTCASSGRVILGFACPSGAGTQETLVPAAGVRLAKVCRGPRGRSGRTPACARAQESARAVGSRSPPLAGAAKGLVITSRLRDAAGSRLYSRFATSGRQGQPPGGPSGEPRQC